MAVQQRKILMTLDALSRKDAGLKDPSIKSAKSENSMTKQNHRYHSQNTTLNQLFPFKDEAYDVHFLDLFAAF